MKTIVLDTNCLSSILSSLGSRRQPPSSKPERILQIEYLVNRCRDMLLLKKGRQLTKTLTIFMHKYEVKAFFSRMLNSFDSSRSPRVSTLPLVMTFSSRILAIGMAAKVGLNI